MPPWHPGTARVKKSNKKLFYGESNNLARVKLLISIAGDKTWTDWGIK